MVPSAVSKTLHSHRDQFRVFTQDSCHLSASSSHGPMSETAPPQTRCLMVRFCNQLLAKSIEALSPDTSEAFRAAVQFMGCLGGSSPLALEPSWGKGTPLSSLSDYLSPFQTPSGHPSPGIVWNLINIQASQLESPTPSSGNFFQRQGEAIKPPAYQTMKRSGQTIAAPLIT